MTLVNKGRKDLMDHLAYLDLRVLLDQMDQEVKKDHLENQDHPGCLVGQETRAHLEMLAQLDHQVVQDCLVLMEKLDRLDHLEKEGQEENQVQQVWQELKE